jgi:hypothetical protein
MTNDQWIYLVWVLLISHLTEMAFAAIVLVNIWPRSTVTIATNEDAGTSTERHEEVG